jgi:hypothetical protein
VGRFIYDRYYKNATLSSLWVTYDGKPLLITTDTLPANLTSQFTMRKMWGLQATLAEREWSFLQNAPQNVAMDAATPEQISICPAKVSPTCALRDKFCGTDTDGNLYPPTASKLHIQFRFRYTSKAGRDVPDTVEESFRGPSQGRFADLVE